MTRNLILAVLSLPPLLAFGEGETVTGIFGAGVSEVEDVFLAAVDCRTTFPVAKLENEPALQGLNYSASSWVREVVEEDSSRTATITARSGVLEDGVFTPDSSDEITVLPATGGDGTFNWQVLEISKKIYQLKHTVRKDGKEDAAGSCVGYFDFSDCDILASQADVETAVRAEFSHPIAVVQDEVSPWQPIGSAVARAGLATDSTLAEGVSTATTFLFSGIGAFTCEYALDGGQLKLVADGDEIALPATGGNWMPRRVDFDGEGEHVVSFAYTASGDGSTAKLRKVQWRKPDLEVEAVQEGVARLDLQEGEVRTPKKLAHVLPFAYSPTNFTGTVVGTSSRVSIVQLACGGDGDPDDVTTWTNVVSGTGKVLRKSADEGEVVWRAKRGVWRATFEMLDGETVGDTLTKILDLRNASGSGLVFFVK